jgi:hypothetical protein
VNTDTILALNSAASDAEVSEIISNEAQVLKRFGPVFQPDAVGTLDEDEFRNFLKFENNKHWTSLERQKNRLCANIGILRETLKTLVDETKAISHRVDEALELHGMGKGTLTAILLVAYPDTYGVWNSTSEAAMRSLDLWPEFSRGATEGEKYLAVNQVLKDVAAEVGVSLWTLDALWWRVDVDGVQPPERKKSTDVRKGRTFDSREKSIWQIKNSVLDTVRNSNGQTTQTTVKRKDLLMSEGELEARIIALLDAGMNRCAITGLEFEFEGDGKNLDFRPSLDRIDSEGHYEKSNVQLVCRFINFWKQASPDDEFRRLIKIVQNQGAVSATAQY